VATAALKSIAGARELLGIRVGEGTVCDGRSKPTSRHPIVAQCFLGKRDIAEMMVVEGTPVTG
jgi:endonuclease YncB( thermonuclease family)